LSINILRFRTETKGLVKQGLTFMQLILVPEQEKVVLDRLVVSEEGVRQLSVDV
jgi:hypothetical protein